MRKKYSSAEALNQTWIAELVGRRSPSELVGPSLPKQIIFKTIIFLSSRLDWGTPFELTNVTNI